MRPALLRSLIALRFLFSEVYANNYLLILWVAASGVAARVLRLLALVAALKAIFVTLHLEHYTEVLQLRAQTYGLQIGVTNGRVMLLVAGVLIILHSLVFLASAIRFRGGSALQEYYVWSLRRSIEPVDLDIDSFIIEKFCPAIDLSISLIEIAMFLFVLVLFVALMSPQTVLFLIPFVITIAAIVLVAGRRRLRLTEQRRNARQAYTRGHANIRSDNESRDQWFNVTRRKYIQSIQDARCQQHFAQQSTGLLMGVAVIAILIYISNVGLDSGQMISVSLPIIFIVLGLRQIMIAANEFGRHLSLLLELRNEATLVERILNASLNKSKQANGATEQFRGYHTTS